MTTEPHGSEGGVGGEPVELEDIAEEREVADVAPETDAGDGKRKRRAMPVGGWGGASGEFEICANFGIGPDSGRSRWHHQRPP